MNKQHSMSWTQSLLKKSLKFTLSTGKTMVVFCNYGSLFAKNWISSCFTLVLYGCNSNQWKSVESQEQKTRESQWAEHEMLCFIIEICVSSLQNHFYWFFWLIRFVCLSGWLVFDTQYMGFCSFHWKYALLGSLSGHDTTVLGEQQQFMHGIPHIATYSIVLMIKYILSFLQSIVSVTSKLFPNIN